LHKNYLTIRFFRAIDNFSGFTDTKKTAIPESKTQICVIHQIWNVCKYVLF